MLGSHGWISRVFILPPVASNSWRESRKESSRRASKIYFALWQRFMTGKFFNDLDVSIEANNEDNYLYYANISAHVQIQLYNECIVA